MLADLELLGTEEITDMHIIHIMLPAIMADIRVTMEVTQEQEDTTVDIMVLATVDIMALHITLTPSMENLQTQHTTDHTDMCLQSDKSTQTKRAIGRNDILNTINNFISN